MFGAGVAFGRGRQGNTSPKGALLKAASAGAVCLAGAALGAATSSRYVNGNDATLALALTPVVVSVAGIAIGEAEGDLSARLWPGLAGTTGLLLLVPQPLWSDWRFALSLVLMPLFTGIGAVIHSESLRTSGKTTRKPRWPAIPTVTLLLTTIFFLLLSTPGWLLGQKQSFFWTAAALDGLAASLTLEALQGLGPMAWSAQFLLIPLVTLLEGAVLLRPLLDARSWAAFVLLLISGVSLAVQKAPERQPVIST